MLGMKYVYAPLKQAAIAMSEYLHHVSYTFKRVLDLPPVSSTQLHLTHATSHSVNLQIGTIAQYYK